MIHNMLGTQMDNVQTLSELEEVKHNLKRELHPKHHSEVESILSGEMSKVKSNMSSNKSIIQEESKEAPMTRAHEGRNAEFMTFAQS